MAVHDINGHPHKYIKFTGDYSKLKSMGYEFQKLFANDYMQWSKRSGNEYSPTTRIWKKGAEVTMDRLTNYEGSFFELYMEYKTNGKELPWYTFGRSTYLRIVTNRAEGSVSFDYELYRELERRRMRVFIEYEERGEEIPDDLAEELFALESITITPKQLTALDELVNLGWVELGTIEVPK
jgi:hypothetical protein